MYSKVHWSCKISMEQINLKNPKLTKQLQEELIRYSIVQTCYHWLSSWVKFHQNKLFLSVGRNWMFQKSIRAKKNQLKQQHKFNALFNYLQACQNWKSLDTDAIILFYTRNFVITQWSHLSDIVVTINQVEMSNLSNLYTLSFVWNWSFCSISVTSDRVRVQRTRKPRISRRLFSFPSRLSQKPTKCTRIQLKATTDWLILRETGKRFISHLFQFVLHG